MRNLQRLAINCRLVEATDNHSVSNVETIIQCLDSGSPFGNTEMYCSRFSAESDCPAVWCDWTPPALGPGRRNRERRQDNERCTAHANCSQGNYCDDRNTCYTCEYCCCTRVDTVDGGQCPGSCNCPNRCGRESGAPTFSQPTRAPIGIPTGHPMATTTGSPSTVPTNRPTSDPSRHPTANPTAFPSPPPTRLPTFPPTMVPTRLPSTPPTETPTFSAPTASPTASAPTVVPTEAVGTCRRASSPIQLLNACSSTEQDSPAELLNLILRRYPELTSGRFSYGCSTVVLILAAAWPAMLWLSSAPQRLSIG